MKKKRNKRLIDFAVYAALILIGFILGKLFNIWYFTIDEKINLVDLLSIIVTVTAAFIVAKVLDKEKQDRRTEKDLILKRVEDIYQHIETCQPKLTASSVPYQFAASQIKGIYTYLNTANKIISNTEIQITEDHKSKIVSNLRKIKDLLTSGNNVSSGAIQLTQSRVIEIEAEFVKLKDSVLFFQIDINNG
jgi:hypothetical protein